MARVGVAFCLLWLTFGHAADALAARVSDVRSTKHNLSVSGTGTVRATSEDQVCVLCHNGNATDINRRPAPPAMTADGKPEETIDFKRMIHQIHTGAELQDGLVIYGFGGSVNDFSHVEFIGNALIDSVKRLSE